MRLCYFFVFAALLSGCQVYNLPNKDKLKQSKPTLAYQPSTDGNTLSGVILEKNSKEAIIYGAVTLYRNDKMVQATETDFDGFYMFKDLEAGIYELQISYVGFPSRRITEIDLKDGFALRLDIKMEEGVGHICCPICLDYVIPLIEMDNTTSGQTITSTEIRYRRSSN